MHNPVHTYHHHPIYPTHTMDNNNLESIDIIDLIFFVVANNELLLIIIIVALSDRQSPHVQCNGLHFAWMFPKAKNIINE